MIDETKEGKHYSGIITKSVLKRLVAQMFGGEYTIASVESLPLIRNAALDNLFDQEGPQIASKEAGREPSLREMMTQYYVSHGIPLIRAETLTTQYIRALKSTPTAPQQGLEPRGCPTPGACSCLSTTSQNVPDDVMSTLQLARAADIDCDTDGDIWGSAQGALVRFYQACRKRFTQLTDDVVRDAERYRYIRHKLPSALNDSGIPTIRRFQAMTVAEFDAAIDAAMLQPAAQGEKDHD